MNLTKKQEEAIRNKSRYKVLCWGRRSGKTTEFAYEALGTAMTIDNARISYYAQTFGDARDIAWDIFLEVFGDAIIKKNETLLEITVKNLKGGYSKISLKGWESVVTANKGRGTENDLLLLDEVAFCRGFNVYWDTVLDPTLLTSKGRVVFGSTPNGFNHFYDLANRARENKTGEWFYSHATSYDNPFNDPVWLENKKRDVTEDKFAQEYLADFRKTEGLVYKEFDRERHLFDFEPANISEYIGGIDFGFTNPAAVIHIKRDYDNNFWITDEWYHTGRTEEQIADYVRSCKFNVVYPDPENPSAILVLNNKGINVAEVIKGKDSIQSGINKVRDLFKRNKLRIHKNCANLISEFETYSYPEKKADKNEYENPIKEHDHGLDALRMAIMTNQPEDRGEITRIALLHQARKQNQINYAR